MFGKPVSEILDQSDPKHYFQTLENKPPTSEADEWQTKYWSAMELVNCLSEDKSKLKDEVRSLTNQINSLKKALGDTIGKRL